MSVRMRSTFSRDRSRNASNPLEAAIMRYSPRDSMVETRSERMTRESSAIRIVIPFVFMAFQHPGERACSAPWQYRPGKGIFAEFLYLVWVFLPAYCHHTGNRSGGTY